ncbi:MAG: type IV pilus modification protein PilV [Lysobacteraceae bacterium]
MRRLQAFPSPRAPQRGFSMIEVMVAVLVLSIGLLGMAALQAATLRNNQSANYRTQASNLAYELIDTARSYQTRDTRNVRSLVQPLGSWSATCAANSTPVSCTGNALTCDRQRWANRVCRGLPNGRGRATFDASDNELIVELCWSDDRTETHTNSANCNNAGEGLGGAPFVVTTTL